jgi:succinoglycan biosynthesis transport protein ExoP
MAQTHESSMDVNERVDVREYLRPIRERWLLIALLAVVVTVASYMYFNAKEPYYTASTTILNDAGSPAQLLEGGVAVSPFEAERQAQNQIALLLTRPSAEAIAKRLNFRGNPYALVGMVKIQPVSETDFIRVTAKAGNPRVAALVANAFARQFLRLRVTTVQDQATRLKRAAERELAGTPDTVLNSAKRKELTDRIRRLSLLQTVPSGSARQLDPAAPSAPIKPSATKNAIFALLISLLIGAGLAYALEMFDRRLRRPGDVEGLYDSRVLAYVPHARNPNATVDGHAALPAELSEGFRTLRTNLDLATTLGHEHGRTLKTVLVTSALAGEGKSVTVRNLALAYAEAGRSVAVIDGDLRNPRLAKLFGVDRSPGLLEVLIGETELAQALLPIATHSEGLETLVRTLRAEAASPAASAAHSTATSPGAYPAAPTQAVAAPDVHTGNGLNGDKENGNGNSAGTHPGAISLLTAGRPCANPAPLLASDRFESVVRHLATRFDTVLVDSAPLLPVSDAAPLLSKLDGALVVTRLDYTTRGAARRVTEVISRVPDANLLGVVANDIPHGEGMDGYPYYGHYGYTVSTQARSG